MAAAQSELSMDEILASIRRIIHEEEDPRNERERDTTNTVNLRDTAKKPTPPEEILAESEAKDVREVQLTSTAAEPAEKPAATVSASATAPAAVAKPEPTIGDSFDTADLRALVSEEVAARRVEAKPLAKPPAPDDEEAKAAKSAPTPKVEAEVSQAAVANQPAPAVEPEAPTQVSTPEADAVHTAVQNLLDGEAAEGIAAAFAGLKRTIEISNTKGSRTLEGMVEDMLRPMLKAWLEENLRPMVEAKVQAEIQRLTGKS